MDVTISVLAGALAAASTLIGAGKLAGAESVTSDMQALGLGMAQQRAIGSLEVLAAAGLAAGFVIPGTEVAAAIGLVLLMAGAVIYQLRARHGAKDVAPPAVLGTLALLVVVGRLAS